MSRRALWYMVAPLYKPAPGGAAVYTDLLARALADAGAHVVVATEAFTGQPRHQEIATKSGTLTIERLFPMRAGRAERDWRSYLAYLVQNLHLLMLPRRLANSVRRTGATSVTVLIHSSLFYNPGVLPKLLGRFRRALPGRTKLVIDFRDPKFDERLTPVFAKADAVIGCSQAIADNLRKILPARVEVNHIPIPFEPPPLPTEDEIAAARQRFGLSGIPYIFNPNGVSDEKRYPEMLEIVRAMRDIAGHEFTALVTIGRSRDWSARDDQAEAEGLLRYVGVVPNDVAVALAGGAIATVILSRIEGLPRSGLETLAIGKPLLAPDIAEFREFIPASVVRSESPALIAKQALELAAAPAAERYPLERHRMADLVNSYRALEPGSPGSREMSE
jgi:glycosyltransferase involved in cell wall biosynthesis